MKQFNKTSAIKSGQYGPYIQIGKKIASLPKKYNSEEEIVDIENEKFKDTEIQSSISEDAGNIDSPKGDKKHSWSTGGKKIKSFCKKKSLIYDLKSSIDNKYTDARLC